MKKKLKVYLIVPTASSLCGTSVKRAAILLFAVVIMSAKVSAKNCPVCGNTVEWFIDNPPTCVKSGSAHYICHTWDCALFGQSVDDEEMSIPPLGHDWNWYEPRVHNQATCTESGWVDYPCIRCDENSELEEIPALGHNMNSIGVCTRCADMESVTLLDDDSAQPSGCKNADRIAAASNVSHTLPVTLSGRTLSKSGEWNTLCLPFSMDATQIAASSLNGATIKELSSTSNLASNGTMTLAFTTVYDATEAPNGGIVAGKPYIVKWKSASGSVSDPTFPDVTMETSSPTAVSFTNNANTGGDCIFIGQYSPFEIVASGATGDNQGNLDEILMLGSGNKLGYSKNERTLKTFRCHFYVPANDGAGARAFVLDFGDEETTGIISVTAGQRSTDDATYTLDGRRINGLPTQKGMYIQNGRKVIIK